MWVNKIAWRSDSRQSDASLDEPAISVGTKTERAGRYAAEQ